MLSISLQRISPLLGPRPRRVYACVPGCESECALSRVDRAFIYSTLKACRWLAVNAMSPSISPALCSIFQPETLACATGIRVFGPLTGRLWGIRRARTGRGEGEGGETSHSGDLEGSTRCCLIENHAALSLMTMHG